MSSSNIRKKIFVIHSWHSASASLYPYIMDGVEHIDQTIKTIYKAAKAAGDDFIVRVDNEVFIPGTTIRENLTREISDASVILVLLDGLRPNVTYEMGIAYGMQQVQEKSIICLLEKDATVLVRNYYPDPLNVPTSDGQKVKILNPKVSISSAFSDTADLLFIPYSRLDNNGLEISLVKLFEIIREKSDTRFADDEIKKVEEELVSPEDKKSSNDIWEDYHAGKYKDVIDKTQDSVDLGALKVRALSLMKLGNMYEAMQVWKELSSNDKSEEDSANFHIGICKYVIGDYEGALNSFWLLFIKKWHLEKVEPWVKRTAKKKSSPGNISPDIINEL